MTRLRTRFPDVEVLEDTRGFAALEEEWEDLYRASPLATPFQSWAWLYSWWESYGEGFELRLVTLRDGGGLLVGLMPLMLKRRRGFGKLLFIGTGQTDYLDTIVREGWEEAVSEAGVRAIGRLGGWQVADLWDVRPTAAAWGLFRGWDGPRASAWSSNSVVVDAKPWDELLMSLGRKKLRSNARRQLRRAEADGVRREMAQQADVEQAARRLVALSRERWRDRWRETGPDHWTPRFESHTVTAARRMTACGLGGISEFRRDGEVVISHFLVFGRDFVGQYMIGAGQEALKRYQFSSLGIWDGINLALSRNSDCFDLLRGEEPYKLQWGYRTPLYRLTLGRNWIPLMSYTAYRVARSRAKRYVHSEGTPQWIKHAYARYHRNMYLSSAWSAAPEKIYRWIRNFTQNSG